MHGRLRCAALLSLGLLAACPAPVPSSEPARRDPSAPRAAAAEAPRASEPAAAPVPSPVPSPVVDPPASDPAPGVAPLPDPPALAAAGVRPVLRSLWRALEAVDAGDAAAMARAMTEDGRWFPPGRSEESVRVEDLQRAMAPWSGEAISLDVRRIIDPGEGPFAAQVSLGSREDPALRYELVLLVEPSGDRIAAVHHFGDPFGPLRMPPSKEEPLDLGPVGDPALAAGAAEPGTVDVAKQVTAAVDAREDEAVRARLTDDVVLHDGAARRTRHGRDGWLAGMRETLGATGHLAVDRSLASARFVVLEGAVLGREEAAPTTTGAAAAQPQEHGFVDVHRIEDGKIAETWHYVNRRGRPLRPRPRP